MVDKMVLGNKFRLDIDSKDLHQQDRKSIAYQYFQQRSTARTRMMQSVVWFAISFLAGLIGILSHGLLGMLTIPVMAATMIIGIMDLKSSAESNSEDIDWGTKNMVRIDT